MEKIIQSILNEKKNLLDKYLSNEEQKEYIEIINNINEDELYRSKVHGLYHSIKVCLFAFIIGKNRNLSTEDMQIIIDAALYHDIGRITDCNDQIHGLTSSKKLNDNNFLQSDIYEKRNSKKDIKKLPTSEFEKVVNFELLRAIIESHALDDDRSRFIFENYFYDMNIDDISPSSPIFKRYSELNDILKDADALDRNRFVDGYNFGLNEKYLRLDESKELVGLSRDINDIYTESFGKDIDLSKLKSENGTCTHGIGFDFFKISSILEHGILSASLLRERNIAGVKNFNGGNARNWISVVDLNLVEAGYTGFETFTKNSVNFICTNQTMVYPITNGQRAYAIERGLPYDKSNHKDEKYVYNEIKKEDIKGLVILKETASKKIDELNFVFNCLDFRTFLDRINYYIEKTNAKKYGYDEEKLLYCLTMYKKILDDYCEKTFKNQINENKKLLTDLPLWSLKINSIIIDMIKVYYVNELGMNADDITVEDIVTYELSKSNMEFKKDYSDVEVIYTSKSKVKKND